MREVKVKKQDLLGKVKVNREKHISEYEEAVVGYKAAAIQEIERGMNKLKRQVSELREGEVVRLAAVSFNLQVPENHARDYDQVIEMLTMSVDEELSIRSDEFACYVMDNWEWKDDFVNVSNVYKGR